MRAKESKLLTRIHFIEEIQQAKQAAFALNVEKMWPVLFLNCGCEEKGILNR